MEIYEAAKEQKNKNVKEKRREKREKGREDEYKCNTCSTFRRKMNKYGFHSKYSSSYMKFLLEIAI